VWRLLKRSILLEDVTTILPDGSGFFVAEIDPTMPCPESPVYWNPWNKVVQDHRTGDIDYEATQRERTLRGLPVPWEPAFATTEVLQPPLW